MKRSIVLSVLMVLAVTGITETYMGQDDLLDTIPYPDGHVLVIQQGETYYMFSLVDASGMIVHSDTHMIPCMGEIDRLLVRAMKSHVHLTADSWCGVFNIHYTLPATVKTASDWYTNEIYLPLVQ
jgi:hypothetical protein